jgi:hypothetical protein
MSKTVCAVAAVALVAVATTALVAVVTTPAFGTAWLSKTTARRIAVDVTAQSCRTVDWCVAYDVVPVRRCRRHRDQRVSCAIAFRTADGRRCLGLATMKRTRGGQIDRGMAVPMNCSPAAPSLPSPDQPV